MATKIIDLEIDGIGKAFGDLGSYSAALFLVRRQGVPLGQVTVPVRNGRIEAGAVRDLLPSGVIARWAAQEEAARHLAAKRRRGPLPTATVAICTRERPDDLARALLSVTAQPDRGGGVLVVDNCPATDTTREVVSRFHRVRYVVETRKGLNNARNRALLEAGTDVVAFCDDDAVPDPGWLDALIEPFAESDVGCVTGLTMPLELESEGQEQFETFTGFSRCGFERRAFRSPPHHPLSVGEVGAGVNMAIRCMARSTTGLFDPALDAGTPTMSGGDHDYFHRLLRSGWTIVYEPRALSWHRHRRTREETRKAIHGYGVGVYAFYTRALLVEREWQVILQALRWLYYVQAPDIGRSLLGRQGARPLDLGLAELGGCMKGPFAYLASRRQARLRKRNV